MMDMKELKLEIKQSGHRDSCTIFAPLVSNRPTVAENLIKSHYNVCGEISWDSESEFSFDAHDNDVLDIYGNPETDITIQYVGAIV